MTVDDNGTGGAIRFSTGPISQITPVTNLKIDMLDNSMTELNMDFDLIFAGDLGNRLEEW